MFADTECFCRTKGYPCNQGRDCPLSPREPARPKHPRVVCKPERRANPYIARAICGLLWLLVCMGAVSLAAIQFIPLPPQ